MFKCWKVTLCVTAIAAALTLSACGGGESTSSSSTTTPGSGTSVADATGALEAVSGPEGSFKAPPSAPGPKVTPGKEVYVVSLGQGIPYFAEQAKALQAAAKTLNWNLHIWDGKLQPNQWLAGIRQAVTAKADAIIGLSVDCASVQAALSAVQAAKIPYINIEGIDCNVSKPGSEGMYTWTVNYQEGELRDWLAAVGKYGADWAIKKTNGNAKVLQFFLNDVASLRIIKESFDAELKKCSGCKTVATVPVNGGDFGPPLQQKGQQALLQYPQANIVYTASADGLVTAGLGQAIRSSQSKPVVSGVNMSPASLPALGSGQVGMVLDIVPGWEGYAAMDALVRIFAGEKPSRDAGIGIRVIDKEHNFEGAKVWQGPIDYVAAYKRRWGAN